MNTFNLNDYLNKTRSEPATQTGLSEFYSLCSEIKSSFFKDWEQGENSAAGIEIQKKAIVGFEKEKNFFIDRISNLVNKSSKSNTAFPSWYNNLAEAVYHENWGMAALAEWFQPEYAQSSSAKIIGERIYFLHEGKMKLMPQKISEERKLQLIKAFLLLTPNERMDRDYYEAYLLDGTRVTIFTEPMTKKNQSALIFRRYLVPNLSFEEQARRGTIPASAIPMLTSMARLGYNVVFLGAVRTAKTTFLSTWQSYEDDRLEGVMVETDPEIPMDKLLPDAPILQLIADGDDLRRISKNLLRSDADYFILAEARDGIALDTAVKIAAKGTKRMKMTFHSRNPKHFPLEAATEIVKSTGGDLNLTMQMVASGFDYLFHFVQLSDKRKKRLRGIYEMNLDENGKITILEICSYDFETDSWTFKNIISEEQKSYGMESDSALFRSFARELKKLSESGAVK